MASLKEKIEDYLNRVEMLDKHELMQILVTHREVPFSTSQKVRPKRDIYWHELVGWDDRPDSVVLPQDRECVVATACSKQTDDDKHTLEVMNSIGNYWVDPDWFEAHE